MLKIIHADKITSVLKGGERIEPNLLAIAARLLENQLQAEGRVLSTKNITDIRHCIAVLMDLVDRAEPPQNAKVMRTSRLDVVFKSGSVSLQAGERFAAMCRRAREAAGLTIGDVAKALPVGEQAYARIESGYTRGKIPRDVMTPLCSVLGLDEGDASRAQELDIYDPFDNAMY